MCGESPQGWAHSAAMRHKARLCRAECPHFFFLSCQKKSRQTAVERKTLRNELAPQVSNHPKLWSPPPRTSEVRWSSTGCADEEAHLEKLHLQLVA